MSLLSIANGAKPAIANAANKESFFLATHYKTTANQHSSMIEQRRYDSTNGGYIPHLDNMSLAPQLLVKG